MDELLDYNKRALFEKLNKVQKINNSWKVNDIIDYLSQNKERDRRYVNDFAEDEITIERVKTKGYLRNVRFFTAKGIRRYLYEGKVFSLKNACEYFNVEYKDPVLSKELETLKEMYEGEMFETKRILKWVFGKRKQNRKLDVTCTLEELLEVLSEYEGIDEKIKLLQLIRT